MDAIRFGLVGTGTAARSLAAAVSAAPGASVSAICGRTLDRGRQLASELGVATVTSDPETLVASPEIDAIIIATPHHLHAPLALAALAAKKHVVVEKPMALTLEDAERMVAEATRSGCVLAPIAQMRFSAGARVLRETLASTRLGRILTVRATLRIHRSRAYYEAAPWRSQRETAGGGVLLMNAIHVVDLLTWAFGPVQTVFGKTSSTALDLPIEDSAVVALAFESGVLATLDATAAADREARNVIDVQGDRGRLRMTGAHVDRLRAGPRADVRPLLGSLVSRALRRESPLEAQMQNIVAAIRKREALVVDPRSAFHAMAVVLGAYRSSAEGSVVSPRTLGAT